VAFDTKIQDDKTNMKILWLRPYTGDNVSVRRERISEHLADMDVSVTLVDATGINALSAIYKAITGDYDVIVGNVRMGLYIGYPLSVVLSKPFVGDVSDPLSQIENLPSPLFNILKRYEWFVLSRADKSVFVTQPCHTEALERGIVDPVRLPNAVNYEQFANPSEDVISRTDSILRENKIDPDNQIAIYHGSMVSRYHLAEIGEAAEQLPNWEFVFIGKDRGADIGEITSNRPNTHFLGAFDYELIPGFLSHSDLGLCLIDSEGPLKLKEFIAARTPTLVIPEMKQWQDYDNLIYTNPEPDAIVSSINKIGNKDRKVYNKDVAETELESWKDIAQTYYEIFEDLCSGGTNRG
jgi:hypothetical protein